MSTNLLYKNVGWKEAIEDAKNQLQVAEKRALVLKGVIRVFTNKFESGEPWPGEDAGTEAGSIPA